MKYIQAMNALQEIFKESYFVDFEENDSTLRITLVEKPNSLSIVKDEVMAKIANICNVEDLPSIKVYVRNENKEIVWVDKIDILGKKSDRSQSGNRNSNQDKIDFSEDEWYYECNDKQFGPISTDELKELISSKVLSWEDKIWREGLSDWLAVGCLYGLLSNTKVSPTIPTKDSGSSIIVYADFWKRAQAALIDWIIISGSLAWITYAFALDPELNDGGNTDFVVFIMSTIQFWLYYAIMESSTNQGTFGKMAVGIKVTNIHGKRVTFGKASGRFFGRYLSSLTFGAGWIMTFFTRKKQTLHDMLSSCLVILK